MIEKGNSAYNGPVHGSMNNGGPVTVRHGEFCSCCWCLQGHR